MNTKSLLPALVAFVSFTTFQLSATAADAPPSPPATAATKPSGKVKNVGVAEFEKMTKSPNAVILDVRTPKEFEEGHLKGAVNIDFNDESFADKVAKLDKNKTYLVHCAAGGRSARACKQMDKFEFKSLVNLEGGMGAWEKAGKPVEKGPSK